MTDEPNVFAALLKATGPKESIKVEELEPEPVMTKVSAVTEPVVSADASAEPLADASIEADLLSAVETFDVSPSMAPTTPEDVTSQFRANLKFLASSFKPTDTNDSGADVRTVNLETLALLENNRFLDAILQPSDIQIMVRKLQLTYTGAINKRSENKQKQIVKKEKMELAAAALGGLDF